MIYSDFFDITERIKVKYFLSQVLGAFLMVSMNSHT